MISTTRIRSDVDLLHLVGRCDIEVIRLKANLTMGGRGLCCTHPVCSSTFDMVRSYRILVGGDGLMASGLCFFSQFYLVI